MFNYIVTVHNSEDHLQSVLEGIRLVKGSDSQVYICLDGCTDGSKAICDEYPDFHQIVTPNVRETKAISLALSQIPQIGYNFILQDDVVLLDEQLEFHVKQAHAMIPGIGVLGFRHGANFEPYVMTNQKHASETDIIFNQHQPLMAGPNGIPYPDLEEGDITERQVVYKSPICISSEVYGKLGGYDPRFEPIAHDDTEYCIRAFKAGYQNYVCAINLLQPVEWGGTRRFSKVHEDNLEMHQKHMDLLRRLYPHELEHLANNHPKLTQTHVWRT